MNNSRSKYPNKYHPPSHNVLWRDWSKTYETRHLDANKNQMSRRYYKQQIMRIDALHNTAKISISFTFNTSTSLLMLIVLVWWLWRMCNTRSHPELDSETVQRLWYFVLRHGKVGRCQTYTINLKSIFLSKIQKIFPHSINYRAYIHFLPRTLLLALGSQPDCIFIFKQALQ